MIKSKNAGLPFANIGDSLELMRKMWGMTGLPSVPTPGELASMAVRLPGQIPSMVAPTIDVEELDKRISDLRAVENWLELNANMVRATIQTLEVQRATVATLKSFGGGLIPAMLARPPSPAPTPPTIPFVPPSPPPLPSFAPPSAAAANAEEVAEPAPARRRKRTTRSSAARRANDAGLNPSAWWNTLQDQFTKIASAALSPAPAPAEAEAPKSAKKAARKRKKRKASRSS